MRHTLQPTVLAASIVASLIGVSAHAATPAELQQIQLYNGVTIAQDSVQSWGPWEQFEAPAAGNRLPMPTFASDASNLYRPIAPVNPPVTPPTGPDQTLSGYGIFLDFSGEGVPRSLSTIEATVSGATASGTSSPSTVSATFAPVITSQVPTDSTGPLSYVAPGTYSSANGLKTATLMTDLTGIDFNAIQAWPVLYTYVSGQGENPQAEAVDSGSLVLMYGAVGRTTSSADMAALRSGNFSATYTGSSVASGQIFVMTAKFGDSKVSGYVGDINTYRFTGTIDGSSVTAKFLRGGTAAVSGSMVGNFTGAQAAGYIGAYQLTTTQNVVVSDSVIAQRGALQAPTAIPASVRP